MRCRRDGCLLLRPREPARLPGGRAGAAGVRGRAASRSSGVPSAPPRCPAARPSRRRAAQHGGARSSARRSSAAPPSSACSRCAGPTRSRSTARSRCASPPTRSRSAATVPFAQAAFRQAFAGGRSLDDEDSVRDRGGGVRDASGGGAARRPRCARSPSSSPAATERRRERGRARRAGRARRRAGCSTASAPSARPPRRCAPAAAHRESPLTELHAQPR